MRGRRLIIEWQQDEATLYQLYRTEAEAELRTRWHALWLLRQGRSVRETAQVVGVHPRTVREWLRWYREGGVDAIRQHRQGNHQGRKPFLTAEQCAQLVEQAGQGAFMSIKAAQAWVKERFGMDYTYWGMRSLFVRLKLKEKVPRPLAAKASLQAQER
ncbi:MAG: helix-turn-helix domain-containing protein [Anaerolineales bacterium]